MFEFEGGSQSMMFEDGWQVGSASSYSLLKLEGHSKPCLLDPRSQPQRTSESLEPFTTIVDVVLPARAAPLSCLLFLSSGIFLGESEPRHKLLFR